MRKQLSAVSYQLSAEKLFVRVVLFLGLALLLSSSASAAAVDETVASLQKQFASIKDLKGKFIQKSYIKDLEDTQEFSGSFFIKKPSRMMWEYAAPRDEKVVINNLETWIYKKSQNQVVKTKFTKETYSQVPIALLGSLENIGDDFDISMPEKNALQLAPKRKIGFIKTIVLELASGDMPVKMFTIFDTYGNIIMIELKNVQTNPGLDDSIFTLKVPPGAEVYDMSK
jgi:chaperone LolA